MVKFRARVSPGCRRGLFDVCALNPELETLNPKAELTQNPKPETLRSEWLRALERFQALGAL